MYNSFSRLTDQKDVHTHSIWRLQMTSCGQVKRFVAWLKS